ncbi:MAG: hypothetical protein RKH07_01455 [Gammaproteobacteria bacterium]
MNFPNVKFTMPIVAILCSISSAHCFGQQIVSVIDDTGDGIESDISTSLGDQVDPLGTTNAKGELPLENTCRSGRRILARPVNQLFYEGTSSCDPNQRRLFVKVMRRDWALTLQSNAEYFEDVGSFGNAAVAYNEIAVRFRAFDAETSETAGIKAIESFAKSISAPEAMPITSFDPAQSSVVITPQFKRYLSNYQFEQGLESDGNLGFRTLSTQSTQGIMILLTNRFEDNGEPQ